jgi:hypothetical protein
VGASSSDGTNAAAAADIIAGDLEVVRQEAIRREESIFVTFSASNGTYAIADAKGNKVLHPVRKTADTIDLDAEVTSGTVSIVSADFGGGSDTVVFNALGEPVSNDATPAPISSNSKVVVQSGDARYSVLVSPLIGRVRVKAGG